MTKGKSNLFVHRRLVTSEYLEEGEHLHNVHLGSGNRATYGDLELFKSQTLKVLGAEWEERQLFFQRKTYNFI